MTSQKYLKCGMESDVILTKQSVAQIQKDIGEIKTSMSEISKSLDKKVDWKYFALILAIGGILFTQIIDLKKSIQDTAIRMERIETQLSFYDIQKNSK